MERLNTVFRNSLFAICPAWAAALAAGPSARVPYPRGYDSAAEIPIVGVLGQADWYVDTDYRQIRDRVKAAVANPAVKEIRLIVDSPGGSVIGLPETARAIADAAKRKPVSAYVPGIGASAAFWLASQASTITASESSELGSVGVIDLHADISKMLEDAGIKLTAVTAGEHKAERAPFSTLTDGAKEHMQAGVDRWYGDFLSAIRRGRGTRVSHTSNYGGGRMLSARDALREGLIDFVSTEGL